VPDIKAVADRWNLLDDFLMSAVRTAAVAVGLRGMAVGLRGMAVKVRGMAADLRGMAVKLRCCPKGVRHQGKRSPFSAREACLIQTIELSEQAFLHSQQYSFQSKKNIHDSLPLILV
jgi:hypothetical protein